MGLIFFSSSEHSLAGLIGKKKQKGQMRKSWATAWDKTRESVLSSRRRESQRMEEGRVAARASAKTDLKDSKTLLA